MRTRLVVLALSTLLLALSACTKPSQPDLSGVWLGPENTLQPPPSLTAKGQELFDAAKPLYGPRSVPVAESNDPVNTCDPQGFPRILFLRSPLSGMELIYAPNRLLQVFSYQRVVRDIWTDGRSLPSDPEPRWYGYSTGRWTNDGVFIVETIGANETWGDEEGHPHGLGARIEERYRLLGQDSLELVVTIDDKEMFQQPFVASKQVFKRAKELGEHICVPSVASQYLELIAKPAAGK